PDTALVSLLAATTETVRARLKKCASAATRERINTALDRTNVPVEVKKPAQDDAAEARAAVVVLNQGGKLNDSTVNRFAIRREYPNVIAALSVLSGSTVDIIAPLME